jgi:hypothetical protein
MLLGLLMACGPPAPDRVVDRIDEAFDVPPPPEMRTVRLVGVSTVGFTLGEPVVIERNGARVAVGDLVLDVEEPPSLVVYVPEDEASSLLDVADPFAAGPITVVPP